jgi:hypothetical protein
MTDDGAPTVSAPAERRAGSLRDVLRYFLLGHATFGCR